MTGDEPIHLHLAPRKAAAMRVDAHVRFVLQSKVIEKIPGILY